MLKRKTTKIVCPNKKQKIMKKDEHEINEVNNKNVNSEILSSYIKEDKKNTALPQLLKYEDIREGPPSLPYTGKKYLGSHVSSAGGVWNAFINAKEDDATSFALFLRNGRTWKSKPLDDETVEKWKQFSKGFPSHLILPHGSYLMNLGSPREDVLQKSRDLFLDELKRCECLGISQYNFHPGSCLGLISREECCKRIAESINMVHKKTKGVICVLENMCKQGHTIGGDFHELRYIIELVEDKTRVGVCLDTCHSHAAGFDLSTEEGFEHFLSEYNRIIGWKFLRALHINDSKGVSGSRRDLHENIGKGTIGINGFKRIVNCPHFDDMPLILETPYKDGIYAKEIIILKKLID